LPTLEAEGKVYTNTTDVVSYLVKASSAEVKTGGELIAIIHEDKYDPNFAFLAAVSCLILIPLQLLECDLTDVSISGTTKRCKPRQASSVESI
jgi:hypothetical protein